MDVEISPEVRLKRRKRNFFIIGLIIAVSIVFILFIRIVIKTSVKRSDLTIGRVEIGSVENTLNATGEVLPEFEEVLTSPINASIKNVLLGAGAKVKVNQSILTLDKSASETDYEKINFQVKSKINEIAKLRLDLSKSFFDVRSNNDIKQLRISNLADGVENAKRLFKAGGGTREAIEQAELNLKIAQLEKRQLENEIISKQQTMQIEIKEAQIALSILQNDLKELYRKLQLANIVSTRSGVVTWVNKNVGAAIQEGESLARIADLGSFKINGNISDNYINQLHNGLPVIIRISDKELKGHIANIYPSIQNSIVTFDVQIDEGSNAQLRPNMKVDLFVVTQIHNKVMRVANGPAFKGPDVQDVFVIKGDKAERRTLHIGLRNFDYVEIKDGINPGDIIITSDMGDYKNNKELAIKEE